MIQNEMWNGVVVTILGCYFGGPRFDYQPGFHHGFIRIVDQKAALKNTTGIQFFLRDFKEIVTCLIAAHKINVKRF
jgi:hypothetical protein